MSPKALILRWVELFNQQDAQGLADLYHEEATNHQVVQEPIHGKAAIQHMFEQEFAQADMTCIVERIYEDGEWAIMEWKDPLGLRGCGFFQVKERKIVFQRGYFDMLTFLRQQALPLPKE